MANAETEIVVPDEGELAADYLEALLDIADLDGDIEIEVRQERTYVTVGSPDTDDLDVLSAPDVVLALQDLTRLAVQQKTGEFARLILDVGGSRDARAQELEKLVAIAISKIDAGAQSAALPPMSSYERKLVHDMVSDKGYHSASEGEGRDRHTVITAAP
jgi:spoIIIJ-associated protein